MPLVFVHGVTVREDRYQELLTKVRSGIHKKRPSLAVEGFYWGSMASSLRFSGSSIPGFAAGAKAAMDGLVPMSGDVRSLLMDLPLLELEAIKDAEDFDPYGAGFLPLPPAVATRNQTLTTARSSVAERLLSDQKLDRATDHNLNAADVKDAVNTAFEHAGRANRDISVAQLIEPLSRAIAARLYQVTENPDDVFESSFEWSAVEERVEAILEEQFSQPKGLFDVGKNILLDGATFALRHGLRRRVMSAMSIFIGDVIVYESQREKILSKLEKDIARVQEGDAGPLWLVGHSLGGVIACDYAYRTTSSIQRLITVGSQPGLFGEIGALAKAEIGAGGRIDAPASVEQWINVYDPDDMLSFLAEPIFTKVEDAEVDTGAPFPISHGEYWNREEVYTICAAP